MQEIQEMWVRSLGWEDSPGEGRDNPLQYSCLQNSKDRGTCRLQSLELQGVLNTHIFIGTWTYITKRDPLKFLAFNQLKIMPLSISENYVLNVILLSRNTHKTRLHIDQLTKMLWWGRKGTGRADYILKKKEMPSCTFSEHWTMYLVATGIIHLWLNWPPGLINTRFHTKISRRQKKCNNPLCSQSPL